MATSIGNGESSWHNSTCPHDCPSACSLQVEKIAPDRIGRVRGSSHNPYTDGVICAKVSKYAERTHHPDRLTQPLIRVSGKDEAPAFEPIDWDAALDIVARKFRESTEEFGPESIWPYYYGGTMGLVQRDSMVRFANTMGYSNLKKTICVQIAYDGWQAGTGKIQGTDPRELAHSDLILLWGCNAAATQINVMHHVSKARKRGARLVVIDPYETATAKIADLHIAPRPGTDGALACAVMHQLFQDGKVDRNYLDQYTANPAQFEQHLSTRDAEWAEKICGVSVSQIKQLAEWYGSTKASYIRLGIGFSRSRNGAVNVHAVSCLPALTGAWKHRGGGALLSTGASFHLDSTRLLGLDQPRAGGRTLDMCEIGAILCGDQRALQHGPPVKAMLIQNTNPMLVSPDLGKVRKGLQRKDLFVCVHEQVMTETAMLADLVLPATTFVEHDDMYRSYGHTFIQVANKVIEPIADCRSNHDVLGKLMQKLDASATNFSATVKQEIADTLAISGYPQPEQFTEQHFLDCAPSFNDAHFIDGFAWPDGLFRFAPDWKAIGPGGENMPIMPDHWEVTDERNAEHPLRLVAAPSSGFLNSSFNTSPSSIKREKKPWLKIHPDTAAQYQIKNEAQVMVGNSKGSVTLTASLMQQIQHDTVVVEGIWPANAFPEGIGINVLISAEPASPNGGAVFHDTAVWVKPVSTP